tara:strand:+ start:1076 stop:1294 length:219 start_codon:yes stop_codon:yes gene_type:complete
MVLGVAGCVSQQRTLTPAERKKFGLNGIIHDAPLCPTEFQSGKQVVAGNCEYVTCLPRAGAIQCVAKKKARR